MVGQDLDVGQSGGVVDPDVDGPPAGSHRSATGPLSQGAFAGPGESPGVLMSTWSSSPACRRAYRFGGSAGSRRESRFNPKRASTAITVDTAMPR